MVKIIEYQPQYAQEVKDFIEDLNPLNIEARYPKHKEQLSTMLTREKCIETVRETEKLLCWIKEQL